MPDFFSVASSLGVGKYQVKETPECIQVRNFTMFSVPKHSYILLKHDELITILASHTYMCSL